MPNAKTNKDKNPDTNEFARLREGLVAYMQQTQVLRSSLITEAFLSVPREKFIGSNLMAHAYEDTALPSIKGQTISQPSTVAAMLELLDVHEGMNVLEVGSGTGYVLALLSHLVGKEIMVRGIELDGELVEFARERMRELKIKNVEIMQGDGALGWEEFAPYDRILVSAACPFVPPALFKQLKEKGHCIAPVGDSFTQQMIKMAKFKGKIIKREIEGSLYEFVPLKSKTFK